MNTHPLSRRDFLVAASIAMGGALAGIPSRAEDGPTVPDFLVFSKVYQELKLDYRQSVRLTADAGLQGVDATVRPGGEVLPERVQEDLPKYVELLRGSGLKMPAIATGITGPDSPHLESVLRTAKRLGVQYYRLGPKHPSRDTPLADQVREYKRALKELAAINQEIGINGVLQNHSPSGQNAYFGGDLDQMRQLLDGISPRHLGMVFDIGHAVVVHGDQWRELFEPLKPHLRLVYVKDVRRPSRWLPMGEGEIHQTGYFEYLKQIKYSAPISIHVEYAWQGTGPKEPGALLKALKRDVAVVRRWFA